MLSYVGAQAREPARPEEVLVGCAIGKALRAIAKVDLDLWQVIEIGAVDSDGDRIGVQAVRSVGYVRTEIGRCVQADQKHGHQDRQSKGQAHCTRSLKV